MIETNDSVVNDGGGGDGNGGNGDDGNGSNNVGSNGAHLVGEVRDGNLIHNNYCSEI